MVELKKTTEAIIPSYVLEHASVSKMSAGCCSQLAVGVLGFPRGFKVAVYIETEE